MANIAWTMNSNAALIRHRGRKRDDRKGAGEDPALVLKSVVAVVSAMCKGRCSGSNRKTESANS